VGLLRLDFIASLYEGNASSPKCTHPRSEKPDGSCARWRSGRALAARQWVWTRAGQPAGGAPVGASRWPRGRAAPPPRRTQKGTRPREHSEQDKRRSTKGPDELTFPAQSSPQRCRHSPRSPTSAPFPSTPRSCPWPRRLPLLTQLSLLTSQTAASLLFPVLPLPRCRPHLSHLGWPPSLTGGRGRGSGA
jgi:hypothetical protein